MSINRSKTAISLDPDLFARADSMAAELQTTRSGLIARALEEFLDRRENRRLLDQINRAHSGRLDDSEKALLDGILDEGARLPDGEW